VLNVQVENCLCQRFSGTRACRRREIAYAIFADPYMYVGLVDDQAIQGNFASPPGIDAQTSVHFEMPYRDSNHLRFVVRDDATGRIGSSEIAFHPA